MRSLRIYNKHMLFMGEIDDYSSLTWTRRWQEPGEFSVTAIATHENVILLKTGFFVWIRGEAECGFIESVIIKENNDGTTVEASGRFAEGLFAFRRIKGTPYRYRARAEAGFRAMIQACAPLFAKEDGIGLILTEPPEGNTKVEMQATYRCLLTYLTRLAKMLAMGFRLRPDFVNKTMTFEVYKGEDTPVILSDRYENLLNLEYSEERKDYANICYVIAGSEDERDIEIVGDDSLAGLDRRETIYESRASRTAEEDDPDADEEGEIPEWRYRDLLREDGRNELENHIVNESSECEVDYEKPFVYGKDWDLGDTVILRRREWDLDERKRVSEVSIVTENGVTKVIPTLGDPLPETIEWEDSD